MKRANLQLVNPDTGEVEERDSLIADLEDRIEGYRKTCDKQAREIGALARRIAEEDDPAAHPLGKEIVALIERWKLGAGHAKSKTSADRVKAVKARLKDGYSIEQLELAVDGICAYPFVTNGGRARTGQPSNRHDRLGIALGGGEKVEEFTRLGYAARKAGWTPEQGWATQTASEAVRTPLRASEGQL